MGREQRDGAAAAGVWGMVVSIRGAPCVHVLPVALGLEVVHRRGRLLAYCTPGFTAGSDSSRRCRRSGIPGAGAIGLQSSCPGSIGGDRVALGTSAPLPPG